MSAITTKQNKLIWVLVSQKGLEKDDLYLIINQVSQKEHLHELTKEEANRVIDRLHLRHPTPKGMLTTAQEAYIKDLAKQLGWHTNPKRLIGFVRKYAKVDDISWLTVRQASNVIEGLKRQVTALENEGKLNK